MQALRSPSKVHVFKKKSKKNQRSPSSVPSRKFQGGPSSVPKQRQYVRKHFKGVPQRCLNKKKRSKKSFKAVPQVCPNKKKCVLKKGSNPASSPILRSDPQIRDFTPFMGTLGISENQG